MPEPAVGEKLAERLHALEVKESSRELEKGYVYVDEQDRTPYILRHYWVLGVHTDIVEQPHAIRQLLGLCPSLQPRRGRRNY